MSNPTNAGQALLQYAQESNKVAGQVWNGSGSLMLAHKDELLQDELTAENLRNGVMSAWTRDVDGVVPDRGISSKDGSDILLRHDGTVKGTVAGQIKFRTWDVTANTAKGLATICSAIAAAGWDAVFPGGILIGKTACEALAKNGKPGESAFKSIKRAIKLIEDTCENLIDPVEVAQLDTMMAAVMMQYNMVSQKVKATVKGKK